FDFTQLGGGQLLIERRDVELHQHVAGFHRLVGLYGQIDDFGHFRRVDGEIGHCGRHDDAWRVGHVAQLPYLGGGDGDDRGGRPFVRGGTGVAAPGSDGTEEGQQELTGATGGRLLHHATSLRCRQPSRYGRGESSLTYHHFSMSAHALVVTATDQPGLLARLTKVFADHGANITSLELHGVGG